MIASILSKQLLQGYQIHLNSLGYCRDTNYHNPTPWDTAGGPNIPPSLGYSRGTKYTSTPWNTTGIPIIIPPLPGILQGYTIYLISLGYCRYTKNTPISWGNAGTVYQLLSFPLPRILQGYPIYPKSLGYYRDTKYTSTPWDTAGVPDILTSFPSDTAGIPNIPLFPGILQGYQINPNSLGTAGIPKIPKLSPLRFIRKTILILT